MINMGVSDHECQMDFQMMKNHPVDAIVKVLIVTLPN